MAGTTPPLPRQLHSVLRDLYQMEKNGQPQVRVVLPTTERARGGAYRTEGRVRPRAGVAVKTQIPDYYIVDQTSVIQAYLSVYRQS